MQELDTFIRDARTKGLSDDDIRKALASQDWDSAVINAALLGVDVPKAPKAAKSAQNDDKRPSVSHLMAALHHILLWFFTGSSTITIAGVVASLFNNDIDSTALASMIAVSLVTFIPYALVYIFYVRRTKKEPWIVPGKVWSIITICLHSIGAMAAAISLIVSIITGGDTAFVTSAALILVLDLIIVTTYLFAAFGTEKLAKLRKIVMIAHIPLLFVLFGVLFSMSALKLGPAQHDEGLRTTLTSSVRAIADYTRTNDKLPVNSSQVSIDSAVRYEKLSDQTYKVCATFETGKKKDSTYYYSNDQEDSYVSEYMFESGSGDQCFTFKSSHLASQDYLRPADSL